MRINNLLPSCISNESRRRVIIRDTIVATATSALSFFVSELLANRNPFWSKILKKVSIAPLGLWILSLFFHFFNERKEQEGVRKNRDQIISHEAFYKTLTQTESAKLLKDKQEGTFILRNSGSQAGQYCLDVREIGFIAAHRIQVHPFSFSTELFIDDKLTEFSGESISTLIEKIFKNYHTKYPSKPYVRERISAGQSGKSTDVPSSSSEEQTPDLPVAFSHLPVRKGRKSEASGEGKERLEEKRLSSESRSRSPSPVMRRASPASAAAAGSPSAAPQAPVAQADVVKRRLASVGFGSGEIQVKIPPNLHFGGTKDDSDAEGSDGDASDVEMEDAV